jgi:hypothetical protein
LAPRDATKVPAVEADRDLGVAHDEPRAVLLDRHTGHFRDLAQVDHTPLRERHVLGLPEGPGRAVQDDVGRTLVRGRSGDGHRADPLEGGSNGCGQPVRGDGAAGPAPSAVLGRADVGVGQGVEWQVPTGQIRKRGGGGLAGRPVGVAQGREQRIDCLPRTAPRQGHCRLSPDARVVVAQVCDERRLRTEGPHEAQRLGRTRPRRRTGVAEHCQPPVDLPVERSFGGKHWPRHRQHRHRRRQPRPFHRRWAVSDSGLAIHKPAFHPFDDKGDTPMEAGHV